MCTTVLSVFFWFGSNPKHIYLFVELSFFLRPGTHPGNTGEEILYYHLYHEEEKCYLDVRPQIFNRHFIILLSLSSQ